MYVRKATRRRLSRASFIILALLVLAPKVEMADVPQLTGLLIAVGLEVPRSG
ncbi:hypothetical protein [Devosia sediminis]|uniref:Uncharacterized protein n=1 Tax=Devosia sediminis TaxID=2798801 RepID=A0A934IUH8_9HYPH|nr:hypothetical protein [Devosia sediminis]MBJ3783175.1 hypothetical protein [Devosia sediminis]